MYDTSTHTVWGEALKKVGKLKVSEKVQLGSDQKKETGKEKKKKRKVDPFWLQAYKRQADSTEPWDDL